MTDNSFSKKWTRALKSFSRPLLSPFLFLSHHAATHPKTYIAVISILSVGLMVLGIATNFTTETSDDIWTPVGSRPLEHGSWVADDSGFPKSSRSSVLIVHRNGKNLFGDDSSSSLALESGERLFEALGHFQATPRYGELCQLSGYTHPSTNETDCQIVSATAFWNDSATVFQAEATSDDQVLSTMSAEKYPFGGVVDRDQIIGYNKFDENTNILNYGETYVTVVFLPVDKGDDDTSEAFSKDFEKDVIDRMLELQDQWDAEDGNDFKVEIITDRSFEDEFTRAVTGDLPLLPIVFVLMSVLCIFLFMRKDPVLSRSWLGFGAVVTVLLAIVASFGLLFTIGVPFTSLTPLLPFIIFGVGLDDAFIISGAYARTDPKKDAVDRIQETMEDIGPSILLTTLTSTLAFGLGGVSSIPAVRYLVFYAFPTIAIDFLFQVTFFVALIVLDQKRVDDNRRDCCFCCKGKDTSEEEALQRTEQHCADRIMAKYSVFLLKPVVKWIVIVLFAAMFGFFSWRTSLLTQYFDFTSVIPSDSYIQTWWDAYQDHYEANGVRSEVYFRNVDFADQSVQDQMEAYVQELAGMKYAGENEPFSFWLRDFRVFVDTEEVAGVQDLAFDQQIELFLQDPVYFDSHHEDIVLDDNGVMTASRTLIRLNNVNEEDVVETVDVLETQRSISASQPVNEGLDDWSFFTFAEDYYIWEFYRVSPQELQLTTIIGTITVSVLALIFIPHWSAILFVFPIMCFLYIDLLGWIELLGLAVNPVMYISYVMSIGLMVDFVIHIILRYMETTESNSRTKKTKETLETIGASVLVGGFSTMVGVIPLGFSSSEIFFTTFVIFFGLVFLGLLHGLVLLPVLLSMFGPLDSITDNAEKEKDSFASSSSEDVRDSTSIGQTGRTGRRDQDEEHDDDSVAA